MPYTCRIYEIGISNLGMMILYNLFNEREDVSCKRIFSPWTDLDKVMRQENISLFAPCQSQDPVKNFDFWELPLDTKCVIQTYFRFLI